MRTLGAVTLLALVLGGTVGCTTEVASGGTGGTGAVAVVSEGSITAVGSIWVNGVEYDTTDATVVRDGIESIDFTGTAGGSELMPGMVVRVEGNVDPGGTTGKAVRVTYRNVLQGPVEGQPTAGASSMTVLGQKVVVDPVLTRLQGMTDSNNDGKDDIGSLRDQAMVEVSGFTDPNGAIHATYIESKPGETALELVGKVSSPSQFSFTIGALEVDTSGIGLDVSGLAGKLVEVKGRATGSSNVIAAESVEVEDGLLNPEDIDEAHLEGVVTSVGTSGVDFYLNGQPVNYGTSLEFNGGMQSAVTPGVRLEVEGAIRNGVLVANEISFEDAIELAAPVASVNSTQGTLSLEGLGLQVAVREGITDYEGTGITGLADIPQGAAVEIRARQSENGTLLATNISVQDSVEVPPKVVLQGPVDSITNSTITVLGIPIDTANLSIITDEDGALLTRSAFLSALQNNRDAIVEVEGTLDLSTLMWNSVEIDL